MSPKLAANLSKIIDSRKTLTEIREEFDPRTDESILKNLLVGRGIQKCVYCGKWHFNPDIDPECASCLLERKGKIDSRELHLMQFRQIITEGASLFPDQWLEVNNRAVEALTRLQLDYVQPEYRLIISIARVAVTLAILKSLNEKSIPDR